MLIGFEVNDWAHMLTSCFFHSPNFCGMTIDVRDRRGKKSEWSKCNQTTGLISVAEREVAEMRREMCLLM